MNTEERESEPIKSREGGNHDYELNRLIKSGTLMDALLPLLLAWLTWNNLGRQLLDNGSLIHLMLNTNGCEATREGCMGNLEKLMCLVMPIPQIQHPFCPPSLLSRFLCVPSLNSVPPSPFL